MSTTTTTAPTTKVVTGKGRLSYANVWEPRAMGNKPDAKKKYSLTLIIPKSDTACISKIETAIKAAIEAGRSKEFNGKVPMDLPTTFYDGDGPKGEGAEELKNCMFLRCNSDQKPGIIDRDGSAILDKDEVYSGCYGRISVNFYPYNFDGKKGIACGLNNIQKLADGDAFSGRSRAEDDFADAPPVDEDIF